MFIMTRIMAGLHLHFSKLIIFGFSDNFSAENSKSSAGFKPQLPQLLECMFEGSPYNHLNTSMISKSDPCLFRCSKKQTEAQVKTGWARGRRGFCFASHSNQCSCTKYKVPWKRRYFQSSVLPKDETEAELQHNHALKLKVIKAHNKL